MKKLSFLDTYQPYAVLILRILFGVHLIYFTQDNVFSFDRMLEFRDFLELNGFPFPLFSAFLSVIVQFTSGVFLIIGLLVRWVGLVIAINFIVALMMVHWGQDYTQYYPALQLCFMGVFFFLYGAGPVSIDQKIKERV